MAPILRFLVAFAAAVTAAALPPLPGNSAPQLPPGMPPHPAPVPLRKDDFADLPHPAPLPTWNGEMARPPHWGSETKHEREGAAADEGDEPED